MKQSNQKWFSSVLFLALASLLFSSQLLSQNVVVSGANVGNGNYPDVSSAFTAINGGAQTSANISINITGNTTETISAILNAGAWTSLSITPSGGVTRTITGDIAGALIDLNGADNVYVDGLNTSGNALIISNTNSLNATTTTLRFINDATLNLITKCTLLGSSTSSTLGTITYSASTAVGNSSNTVSFCNVGPAGINRPANAIYAAASTTINNSSNSILNCNIYDFFSATLPSSGIFIAANNSNWNLNANQLYFSTSMIYTTAVTIKAIQVNSGNSHTVTNNNIGYATALGTGLMNLNSTLAIRFVGIEVSVASLTPSIVQANTITAISFSTASNASTINGMLCGLNILTGNVNVTSNLIGATSGTGAISCFPSATGGLFVGINSSTTGTINIIGNYIGACLATATTAAVAANQTGINISGIATGMSVSSNTIGNATANNMIAGTATLITAATIVHGINFVSAPSTTNLIVNANLIQNLNAYGTSATGALRGIRAPVSNNYAITSNTIINLNTNNSNNSVGSGVIGTAGIQCDLGGSNYTVSNNYINNIANTGTATTHVVVVGIGSGASTGTVIISENRIYNIINTSPGVTGTTPPVACGFFIRSGTNVLVYKNNMVSLGSGQTSNTSFMGIYGNHGSTPNPTVQVYYNTFNIEGTVTSGSLSTFGIGRTDFSASAKTPLYDIRNNIITNSRTGGTGGHYAIANNFGAAASSITGWPTNASNYNVLNANAATVGWWTTSQTFASWKTASAGDGNSYSGISVTYSNSANNLHLNMGLTATSIESGAQVISGITNDIDNQLRPGPVGSVNGGGLIPDIGADEIDGVVLDISAPFLNASGFMTPSCILSGRTFTASLSDVLGVATGTSAPRVYYRLNAGAYTSVAGTLSSGNINNGVWTFNLTYSALLSDVISYYLVAQDIASTPNLGSFPASGFAGTNVNTITSNPTTPNSFTVSGTLNGIYTVGASATFTSLTAAANAYNTSCLSGPVTFSLVDALYSTAETFPIIFLNNLDASATNSLLIRPASGVAVSITPTNTSMSSVIKFLNARYINLNGMNASGSSLILNNSNTSSASANIWLASSGAGNNFISVANTTLNGGYNGGSNGVIASVDGAVPSATGGSDNDNITITANNFVNFYQAILAVGTASISSGGLNNWLISNNKIGPPLSGTNNITGNGIYVNSALNLSINSNTIQNLALTAAGGAIALINNAGFSVTANQVMNFSTTATGGSGINVNSNNIGFSISQNTIMNLVSSASSSGVNAITGIYLGTGALTGTVSKNYIQGVSNTNTGGYGARGLIVNTGNTSSNISVNSNMISNVSCYTDASAIYWPIGIAVEGTSGNISVDFNSINLFGSYAGLTNANGSSPIYLNSTGGNIILRNNMLSNTYDNSSSSTDISYAIYSNVAASNISLIDYNNYYVGGIASSTILGYLGSNQTNLAGIQTAFGGNLNSKNIAPVFMTNNDLHMQAVSGNATLDNQGTTISGITVDIDNQSRNGTTPDIGADEFSVPVCTVASGGILSASTATACSGQTLVANSSGVSSGLTTSYLWKVASTPGGPYVPVTGGTGSSTPSYTSPPLGVGVYYIVLETICAANSLTATSNEGTLTVYALPTATANSSTTLLCSGQSINLNGSSNIGTSFLWIGPNNYTSTSQNPSISNASVSSGGTYSFVASLNGCSSLPVVKSITVNAVPSAITLSPNSASICSGSSQSILATGAILPTVYNFTNQTNQNTSTTYPAPYSAYYGGQKMQFLVLASELTNQGLSAGILTSIQFPVVSKGSNWGGTITENQNFQVSIKATNLTSVGATFETGLTVVSSATNFTPNVGYSNTHVFGTPFVWNGTSNLIIETVFSNNISGTTNDGVIQYNSPTSYQSTMVYRADLQTFASIAAATTTNIATNLIRPDFKLYGNSSVNYSWSPASSLSSSSGNSVNATPPSSIIYTLVASNVVNPTCFNSATVNLSVIPMPTLSIVSSTNTICSGDNTTLTASGASSYVWDNAVTNTSITVSPSLTTVYTVTGQTQFCGSLTQSISINVNPNPIVSATSSPTSICSGNSATLFAAGASTYNWISGPSSFSYIVSPSSTTVFSVTGFDSNGCSSSASVSVNVTTITPITVNPSSATVCAGEEVIFIANGANTYSWSSGSAVASETIFPLTNGSYTVTGFDLIGCSTTQTVSVVANQLPIVLISPASPTICNKESIVLTASGASTYTWNPGTAITDTLQVGPTTTSSYTLTGKDANNCLNSKVVVVNVNECLGIQKHSLNSIVNLYPNPSTGIVTAEFEFDGSKEIVVMNSVGAIVLQQSTEDYKATLDFIGLAKGVYFVKVLVNSSVSNYKLVIQ